MKKINLCLKFSNFNHFNFKKNSSPSCTFKWLGVWMISNFLICKWDSEGARIQQTERKKNHTPNLSWKSMQTYSATMYASSAATSISCIPAITHNFQFLYLMKLFSQEENPEENSTHFGFCLKHRKMCLLSILNGIWLVLTYFICKLVLSVPDKDRLQNCYSDTTDSVTAATLNYYAVYITY